MQFKHGPIEIVVIVLVIAAGSQWLNYRSSNAPSSSSTPAAAASAKQSETGLEGYRVEGLYLGMTSAQVHDVLRPMRGEVQTKFDSSGGLRWVMGQRFSFPPSRLKPNPEPGKSKSLIELGNPRSFVLEIMGSPVAYNDNDSKWGYWTRGLPNREMGILFSFRGDQVESIEMASQWGELAGHLATPVIERVKVPEPVEPPPNIQNIYNPPPQPSPKGGRPPLDIR